MSLINDSKKIITEMSSIPLYFLNNRKYFRVLQDQLRSVIDEEIYSKMDSKTARKHKSDMSININYLQKIVNKLQVYNFDVTRTPSTNSDLFDYLSSKIHPDTQMSRGSDLYNASKSTLIKVYLDSKNNIKWKPLPNDRYYLWTDDVVEDNVAKVVVEVIKTIDVIDPNNNRKTGQADLLFMWSKTEFLAIDTTGKIHLEYMKENNGKNLYNFLPFVHINKDSYNILPSTDLDTLNNILQINSILTDANVGNYFHVFPKLVAKNIDATECKFSANADDIIVLNSGEGSDKDPSLDVVSSGLDTTKSTDLAKEIMQALLDAKGLVAKDATSGVSNKSGLSQMIENTDTTEVRKTNIQNFKPAEHELWEISAKMHNYLIDNKINDMPKNAPKKKFNDSFEVDVDFETVNTMIEDQKDLNTTNNTDPNNTDNKDPNNTDNKDQGNNNGDTAKESL